MEFNPFKNLNDPKVVAADEAALKARRERIAVEKAKQAAEEKIEEADTYSFDDARIAPPDTKALNREKQIETQRPDIAGM